jgi:hypothetical protein
LYYLELNKKTKFSVVGLAEIEEQAFIAFLQMSNSVRLRSISNTVRTFLVPLLNLEAMLHHVEIAVNVVFFGSE